MKKEKSNHGKWRWRGWQPSKERNLQWGPEQQLRVSHGLYFLVCKNGSNPSILISIDETLPSWSLLRGKCCWRICCLGSCCHYRLSNAALFLIRPHRRVDLAQSLPALFPAHLAIATAQLTSVLYHSYPPRGTSLCLDQGRGALLVLRMLMWGWRTKGIKRK